MELSIGSTEPLVRVLIGLLLSALGVFHVLTGAAAIAGYIVGAVALVTGPVRFCPRLEAVRHQYQPCESGTIGRGSLRAAQTGDARFSIWPAHASGGGERRQADRNTRRRPLGQRAYGRYALYML